jgi:thiol-disulfide isomerase/thioredoxin
VGSFLERHQSKILAVVIVLSAAGLIWLDEHRQRPIIPKGEPAPPFVLELLDDHQRVTLSSLHGKPAVLDFWATWCAPCRASLPHFNDLTRRYGDRVRFIAVNAEGEDEALVKEARDKLKLEIPVAADGREASNLYHVEVLPTTIILDRNGRIAATFSGPVPPERIATAVDKLL